MPPLTALLPVKGYHEPYLHEAMRSVLAQTSPDWRLLVITAAAQGGQLEEVLADYLEDSRVELIASDTGTIAANLNAGMRSVDTEFVSTLLGDDLWAADTVEVLSAAIAASPETDLFHSSRRYVDERGRSISSVYASRPTVCADDFVLSAPVKHLLCWRRETGLAVGGLDESLGSVGVDDFDFPWTMADHGATFQAVPECLYICRDHREHFRLTTHIPLSHHKRELARIMRKHGADESAIATRLAKAERSYLRQCLYRSRLDRWVKTLRRHDPRTGWREPYR